MRIALVILMSHHSLHVTAVTIAVTARRARKLGRFWHSYIMISITHANMLEYGVIILAGVYIQYIHVKDIVKCFDFLVI